MKYDLDHLSYSNYLAEKHYKDNESVYSVRGYVNESSDLISLQEANLTNYLNKVVEGIQSVWNKFKDSVTKLYNNAKFENLKNLKQTDAKVELKAGDKVPNLNNIESLVKIQPIPYKENMEIPDTVNAFLKQTYPQYFGDISDQKSATDIANEKSFIIAQDNQALSYAGNGNFPGISDLLNFLNNYKNNTQSEIQKDVDNINTSIKAIANASKNNNSGNVNNQENNNQQPQPQQASFKYNTSYGSLFMEADKPISAPEKSAVVNNGSNNSSNTANNQQNDQQKKKSNGTVTYMKTVTKVLSIKFNEANKARFQALRYCNLYMKAGNNNNTGGDIVGQVKQINI